MREFGVGQSLPRTEDWRLLRGMGRFTDDLDFPDMARLYALRSPHANARIRKLDTTKAKAAPGVLIVLTYADVEQDRIGSIQSGQRRARADGTPSFEPPYWLIANGHARHVGDIVAVVVADTMHQAKDAAELIEIDYEPLPSITRTADAANPGVARVYDQQPDNICYVSEFGNKAVVEQAFARAAHVAKLDLTINRVAQVTMEPRGAIGVWDARDERTTIYGSFQSTHNMRTQIAGTMFKEPENGFRVVSYDVGGGFGLKGSPHPEYGLVAWASRKTGRPVKWIGDRSESFVSDHQARDNVCHVELALDAEGKFLALRVRNMHNLGAYLAATGIQCGVGHIGQLSGVYATPAIFAQVTGVFTNTTPTCAYRGAGRPEAAYIVERIIDIAAAGMKIDPAELRRRNLIPAEKMPYNTGFVFTYDSGEFEKNQDAVLKMADWKHFEARRVEARARGKVRGIGIAHVIEQAGGIPDEMAEIRFDAGGAVTLVLGLQNHGQGHETTFRQLAVELLGVAPESVKLRYGDTDAVSFGRGTFGSRSMAVGGVAVYEASKKIIARGKKLASNMLEAAEADIEFKDGKFTVAGTDKSVDIATVAKSSFVIPRAGSSAEHGLIERVHAVAPGITFPNGCHVCEIEIEPETGQVEIVGYWVMDDVGRMVNPMIVKGQLHGGIVQGIGQVLWEDVAYDVDSGQNMSGSFMDYGIARAHNLPDFHIKSNEVMCKNNPLGIKGAGEAGAVGGLPVIMNAICDALRPLGIDTFDMPASPTRLWKAIKDAPKPLA